MKKTVLAYIAGVIDSDGTIGVKRSTYKMRVVKDCRGATYSERICLKQVEVGAVDLIHRYFGGSRYMTKPSLKNGKILYTWQATDICAVTVLRALLPYLRIKHQQARNCIALRVVKERSKKARVSFGRGHIGAAARLPSHTEAMERCHQRAHDLNHVGVR
jgi:hypothetical protein